MRKQHKTKLFKKVFDANADCDFRVNEVLVQFMSKETFVPVMGSLWAKAKARYKKRYHQKALKFTMWIVENYTIGMSLNSDKRISELFEIWEKETK